MQPDFSINILLVDDHPENLLSLEAILEPLGANLVRSNSGEEALRVLLEQDFALILLDVQMPGMDGFETASLIRKRRRSRQTPIIFLTAFSTSSEMLSKGYSLGAVDYLHKPIDSVILFSKATVFVDLFKKTQEIQQQSLALEQQASQLATTNTQLRQSEEQFRLLSEGSPIGIFRTDPQGNLTYTNPKFDAICGFSAPAMLPVELLRAVHPDDQARMQTVWSIYEQGEQELADEFRLLSREAKNQLDNQTDKRAENPAGTSLRWVNVRSRPLFSEQGSLLGHLGTIEDISERKQAEAIRAEILQEQVARQEAEATNRMKDEFLAVLSHELRTPLNAMLGWSKILSDSFAPENPRRLDEATVTRGLSIIQRNAQAQTQLIEDLLDVSRIIQGKLTLKTAPVCLTPIIEAAIESVRPQAQTKNIQILTRFTSAETIVQGDAVRLQQIVWNLISNAIKFTLEGGQVEVKLESFEFLILSSELSDPTQTPNLKPQTPNLNTQTSTLKPQTSTLKPHPPYAQITITDTGIGIASEFLPYVFDRFKQADSTTTRSYTGLGLGLAIVRYLVELHQGTVRAESAGVGQGSTFCVSLPLLEGAGAGEQRSGGAGFDVSLSGRERGSCEALGIRETLANSSSPPSPLLPSTHLSLQILLVDDEQDTRELLAFVLKEQGATVTIAKDAEQALNALAKQSFDLLISDISMPGMDGYELLRKVRSLPGNQNATVPAVALTAHAAESDRQCAFAAGFQAHLAKPIEPEKLIEAIEELLCLNRDGKRA